MARKHQQKKGVFCAARADDCARKMECVMPPLSNNYTATEEHCFLRGPCRDVISRTGVSGVSELVGEWVRELLRFSRCELLLWEAGSWVQGQSGNPEERECPPLEAATKQRLVKTVTDWEELVCPIVICEVCRTVRAKSLLVVTICKSSINPITNPNPVYSHTT
jgi:hypothetical protein